MPISGEMPRVLHLVAGAAMAAVVTGVALAVARSRPETVLLAHGIPRDALRARQVRLELPAFRVARAAPRLRLRPIVVHPHRVIVRSVVPAASTRAAAPPEVPVVARAPRIAGQPTAGRSLLATPGRFRHASSARVSRAWLRCNAAGGGCNTIPDADRSRLVLGPADVGYTIRVAVTATVAGRSATGLSAATAVVAPPPAAPVATTQPSILGFPEVGSDLAADPGVWTPADAILTLQWERCDDDVCSAIPDATAPTYTPVPEDAGHAIRVAVRATNDLGETTAASDAVVIAA